LTRAILVSSSTWDLVLISDSDSGIGLAASSFFLVFSAALLRWLRFLFLVLFFVASSDDKGFGSDAMIGIFGLGTAVLGVASKVRIEFIEKLHPLMLDERFEVAVEEEVEQIRVFGFDKAIEFLDSCQWRDEPDFDIDLPVRWPYLPAPVSRVGG
jgi:hypothetical protein